LQLLEDGDGVLLVLLELELLLSHDTVGVLLLLALDLAGLKVELSFKRRLLRLIEDYRLFFMLEVSKSIIHENHIRIGIPLKHVHRRS